MTLTLRYAARSDRGLIRDGNQDSVYAGPRLLAVADGMGGMAAGDVASNVVIAAMAPLDEDVPGDRYMICSDGLSGVVSAETIAETMREYVDPSQCVDRLVQLALRGGGPDNVTVIVADVTDQDIVEQRPVVGGAAARDRGMTSAVGESTPASRASALQSPRAAVPEVPDEEATERRKRHPVRTAVLV